MNPRIATLLSRSEAAVTAWNRVAFRRRHGRWPNDPPLSFNDHIFHVKTREALDPLRVFVADKALVKLYLTARLGEELTVPTLALYEDVTSLRAGLARGFGERCAIKPTHSSGAVLFADGPLGAEDIETAASWFDENLFTRTGERMYRHLRPRVIVEPFLDLDGTGRQPRDYKVFCGGGRPIYISVDHWNPTDGLYHRLDRTRSYYTPDWTLLPFRAPLSPAPMEDRPVLLDRMLEAATTVAEDFSTIRVDFYASDHRCLIGELTNTSGNAAARFMPDQRADDLLGEAIRDPSVDLVALSRVFEEASDAPRTGDRAGSEARVGIGAPA